ncbi:MAG: hypothetical protein HKM93_01785 [Desulfobacteraceae bacterium]|nr:hypothetical protein [Desulfobacteraceae bacterium]
MRPLPSTQKGEERYQIDIRLGRKKRRKFNFIGTLAEAQLAELRFKQKLGKPASTSYTISDLALDYLEWVRMIQRDKTYRDKKRMLLGRAARLFR